MCQKWNGKETRSCLLPGCQDRGDLPPHMHQGRGNWLAALLCIWDLKEKFHTCYQPPPPRAGEIEDVVQGGVEETLERERLNGD